MPDRAHKEELFTITMQRLSRMGIVGPGITPEHIFALAQEIEGYREKISGLETHMAQVVAERDRLREEVEQLRKLLDQQMQTECSHPHHPAEIENAALREAIVRRFLEEFDVDYVPVT